MDNNLRLNVCLIALYAYPLLFGRKPESIQGPEVQTILLAKEFSKHDIDVTIITFNEGKDAEIEYIDKIRVIKINKPIKHQYIVCIFLLVIYLWKAMFFAQADIFFNLGGAPTGIMSPFCLAFRKIYVYNIASDAQLSKMVFGSYLKEFDHSKFGLYTLGNFFDIKLANAVIIQSNHQKEMLKNNFSREGRLIKMPFPITYQVPEKSTPPIVLWVGSMAKVKQPHLFIELAKLIPNAKFQMIGGFSGDRVLYNKIKNDSKFLSNFEFLGVVPFEVISSYFLKASLLVNTSMYEGFPNAFIQAWINYTPVISLNCNPDGILDKHKIGRCSMTFDKLISDIKELLENKALRDELGKNGRGYAETEHDIGNVINQYIELSNELLYK